MTLYRRTSGTVQLASWTESLSVSRKIWCPMPVLTRGPEPRYPVGWWRSWYDRLARVATYRTSPRAKLESDCVDSDRTTRSRNAGAIMTDHDVYAY